MKFLHGLLKKIAFWFYFLVFRREPGPVAQRFIRNLGYVAFGIGAAKLISFVFQIYVGRSIGVSEYGVFSLVTSISTFLYIPMLMAITTAVVKYASDEKDEGKKKVIVSTGLFSAFFFLIQDQLSALFSVSRGVMSLSIITAVAYAFWVIAQKLLQGLDRMKETGFVNAFLSLATFLMTVFLLAYYANSLAPIYSVIIAYLVAFLVSVPFFCKYLSLQFDAKIFRTLFSYALLVILATISNSVLGHINKVYLNMFLTFKEVGLYQAYYFSTLGVAGVLSLIFITVFFPESSRYDNKRLLFKNMNRVTALSPLIFVALFGAALLVLPLYGSEYAVYPDLLALFSAFAILSSLMGIYTWFSSSQGITGVKLTAVALIMSSALNVVLSYFMVQSSGLYGAVTASVVASAAGFAFIVLKLEGVTKRGGFA
jgi:O-antigen/teichoic acid export membrane protein